MKSEETSIHPKETQEYHRRGNKTKIKRHPHPTSLLWSQQRMSLRVKHVSIQTDKIGLAEQEVEVLQCFARPERLHLVHDAWVGGADVADGSVRKWGATVLLNRREHFPTGVLEVSVSGYAVEDEDGFDRFGSGMDVSKGKVELKE